MVKTLELQLMENKFPCQMLEIHSKNGLYAIVATLKNTWNGALTFLNKPGIEEYPADHVYEIVVDTPFLTKKILYKELNRLTKKTKIKYKITKNAEAGI